MSKGVLVLAQNTKTINYVDQAVVLALSLKLTNPDIPVSIITNDVVPIKDRTVFDQIIDIPWGDLSKESDWKIENRWKVYHATPYNETIVMDTDMLILEDISHWWSFFNNYDLFFTSNVLTYRNELVSNNFYRQTFVKNNLPNIYTGIYYFKKCEFSHNFFSYLETVMNNWQKFYDIFLIEDKPSFISMDVCVAITAKMMDCSNQITNPKILTPTFVHMKPKVQNWKSSISSTWQKTTSPYLTADCELKIGNHLQNKIFHYTEKDFIKSTNAKQKFRRFLNVK